ncbi:MAG TPA: hypothetical protein VGD89_04120 [Flavipsychrobacter sp.]|jgi:hypothetical protein
MKQLMLLLLATCFLTACSGWDSEHKDLFLQGCISGAVEDGMSEAAAKSMCDCRLEVAQKKYPKMSDAFEHLDSLMADPDMKACK